MTSNEKYIEDIANEQLLSDKEEQELAEKIKVGDARALEKLTKANLKFVVSLAHQYRNRGLGEDDLISEGNIGMMYAAQKFDGSKGVRFVVFAAPYIRNAMEEAIKEQATLYKLPKNETSRFEQKRSHAISIDQPVPVGIALLMIFFIGDPFKGLIISQMFLSVQLPFTVFLQVGLTSSKRVMGKYANSKLNMVFLYSLAGIVTLLNIWLLIESIS